MRNEFGGSTGDQGASGGRAAFVGNAAETHRPRNRPNNTLRPPLLIIGRRKKEKNRKSKKNRKTDRPPNVCQTCHQRAHGSKPICPNPACPATKLVSIDKYERLH